MTDVRNQLLPQSMNNDLLQFMFGFAEVCYSYNVTKDKMIVSPYLLLEDKQGFVCEKIGISDKNNFSEIMKEIGTRLNTENIDSFVMYHNTATLLNRYENGDLHFVESFEMDGIYRETILGEFHTMLFRDEESGDVHGATFVLDKLFSQDRKNALYKAIEESETDALTGCYNRKKLESYFEEVLSDNNATGAFIALDIDGFKRISDIGGRRFGDKAIKELSQSIRAALDPNTFIARINGDEFGIILQGVDDIKDLNKIAQTLNQKCRTTITTEKGEILDLTVSIGVVLYPNDGSKVDDIIHFADTALYRSKMKGKDCYTFYSEIENTGDQMILQGFCDYDCRNILDSFKNLSVYVVDEATHKVLLFNNRLKKLMPHIKIGMSCKNMFKSLCNDCIIDRMGEKAMLSTVLYSEIYGETIQLTATRIKWRGHLPAIMVTLLPNLLAGYTDNELENFEKQTPPDYVTGGFTRAGFIHAVELLRNNVNNLTNYAVLFINIKNFKIVNEILGSDGGDNLLRTVYNNIMNSELHPLIGSRKESDHFVFFVEKRMLNLSVLAELLDFHWEYDNRDMFIHCRCGVYNIDDNALPIYKMIDRAKLAVEYIVQDYVKSYAVFEYHMLKEYSEKVMEFSLFDNGIKNKEFSVYYQPITDAKTGKIIAAEALVRRITADGTVIPPSEFIPILEDTGFITKLDEFVGESVAALQHSRQAEELPIIPISFNLSQRDFYDTSAMERLIQRLSSSTLPKGAISLEMTETAYAVQEIEKKEYLIRLRECGAMILLDDFGTGYSSLGMFSQYIFDKLKLDMSFVRQLPTNKRVQKVVQSVIKMCHDMDIDIVAEGVETEEELSILRDMECDYIQGYYYSKPLNETDFIKYLEAHI